MQKKYQPLRLGNLPICYLPKFDCSGISLQWNSLWKFVFMETLLHISQATNYAREQVLSLQLYVGISCRLFPHVWQRPICSSWSAAWQCVYFARKHRSFLCSMRKLPGVDLPNAMCPDHRSPPRKPCRVHVAWSGSHTGNCIQQHHAYRSNGFPTNSATYNNTATLHWGPTCCFVLIWLGCGSAVSNGIFVGRW